MKTEPWLEETPDGTVLHFLVQPKASKSEIVGLHGEPARIRVRIAAPPVDGEANAELLRFLKKFFHLPGFGPELLRGATSKKKDVLCRGLVAAQVREKLNPVLES